MKVCPICGYPNPDDAIYCARCGYRFPTTSQQYGPQQQPNPTFTQPQPSYSQQPPQQPSPPQNPAQPGAPPGYGLTPDEIDGLKKIRKFGLFYILALILVLIGVILIFPLIFMASSITGEFSSPAALTNSSVIMPSSVVAGVAGSLAALGLIIAGGIISILSFIYLLSGYSSLRRVDNNFNLPYYGLLLDLIAAVIGIVGTLALLAAGSATGNVGLLFSIFGLFILVVILGLIGYIMGYIIGAFRLNSRYNEGDFKIAGIMYITAIFSAIFTEGISVDIFAIIGAIFMYLGAGKVLRRAGVT